MNIRFLSLALLVSAGLSSCVVSKKKFDDMTAERNALQKDNSALLDRIDSLGFQAIKLRSDLEDKQNQIATLRKDSSDCAEQIQKLKRQSKDQNSRIEELIRSNENIVASNQNESNRLSTQLKQLEALLAQKAKNLSDREAEAKRLSEELELTRKNLEAREQKVQELQQVLNRKDSVVNALQKTVSKALNGFTGSGLNITKKNGKIYVSLSEQLLFASGSKEVEARGKQALKELAKVLESNPDINIVVEGHTDDVGENNYNWDLSVGRATSIVRILTETSKIDPKRITASGRGKFVPIDSAKTPEARQKNRRTEIILTPKLDDLFQIIESN